MSELSLEMTEKFIRNDYEFVRSELNQYLNVRKPTILFRKSADPTLISFIELAGEVVAWMPIKAAATVFLSRLAFRAADVTWDNLASLRKDKTVKPLKDVAATLVKAADLIDGELTYRFGLKIPHDNTSTEIFIEARSPEEVERVLVAFVVNVEELYIAMKAEIDAGRTPPLRHVLAELQDNGSLHVKWQTEDLCSCELRIPRR